jgi:hypothetical protein
MDQAAFLEAATPVLTGELVLALVSLVISTLVGVYVLTRGRVPPLIAGLGLAPLALGAPLLARWALTSSDPVHAVFAGLAALLLAIFFVLPAALAHGLLTAVAGGRGPGRRWALPLVALVPLALAVVLPAVGGLVVGQGTEAFGILRTVLYAPVALLLLPAMLASEDGPSGRVGGPQAAASASLGFALVVGLGEASGRAMFWFTLLGSFSGLPTVARREALVQTVASDLAAPLLPWSLAAVAAACLVGAIGLIAAWRRGRKNVLVVLGAVWLPLAFVPLLVGDVPLSAWQALAAALPLPAP